MKIQQILFFGLGGQEFFIALLPILGFICLLGLLGRVINFLIVSNRKNEVSENVKVDKGTLSSSIEAIERLAKLRNEGFLSFEEFEKQKKKILNNDN
jgi:hypothetical protein